MVLETNLLYLFFALIISLILYPIWIKFVYKYQMGEEVRTDGPKTHFVKKGTPTMGGLVFVLTVAFVTVFFNRSRTQTLFPLFVTSLAAMFGLLDDFSKVYKKSGLPSFFRYHFGTIKLPKIISELVKVVSIPWVIFTKFTGTLGSSDGSGSVARTKFLTQGIIASFVAYWTYFKLGWDYFWFPFIGNVHLGLLYPFIIFFLFLAVLNFVAFTDGLDGLAGGLSLFAFLAFWGLSAIFEYNSLAIYCATFIGAMLPFLYFNVYPARLFMGNIGSHVLGATLVLLPIILHREFALVVILAVFLVDGLSSPIQQFSVKLTGKRVFLMAPLHHHFETKGWPEAKVTFRFWIFGMIAALLGVFIALL